MWLQLVKPLLAWVWLSGFAAGAGATGVAPEPTVKAENDGEITAKYVAIQMKKPDGSGCLLEGVTTRKLGGATFLVGRVTENGTGAIEGAGSTLWIATDNIAQMIEFQSLEESRKLYRAAGPSLEAAGKSGVEQARYTPTTPTTLPRDVVPPEKDYHVMSTRTIRLPVLVLDADRIAPKGIWVYVSTDSGKTWTKCGDASAGDGFVTYSAPADGEYWFAVQTIARDGTAEPPAIAGLVVSKKVLVRTTDSGSILPEPADVTNLYPIRKVRVAKVDVAQPSQPIKAASRTEPHECVHWHLSTRSFRLPIHYQKDKGAIRELKLFVSRDLGATWNTSEITTSAKEFFTYEAPEDGTYWFQVVTVDPMGVMSPADLTKVPPEMKVTVDTVAPTVKITDCKRAGNEVSVKWLAKDDNLNADATKVYFREAKGNKAATWRNVRLPSEATTGVRFDPETTEPIIVKVVVADASGTKAEALLEVPVQSHVIPTAR